MFKLELNEYIEKFKEIKPLLDQLGEDINIEEVLIVNDGCNLKLVNKIEKYLQNFDIITKVL